MQKILVFIVKLKFFNFINMFNIIKLYILNQILNIVNYKTKSKF